MRSEVGMIYWPSLLKLLTGFLSYDRNISSLSLSKLKKIFAKEEKSQHPCFEAARKISKNWDEGGLSGKNQDGVIWGNQSELTSQYCEFATSEIQISQIFSYTPYFTNPTHHPHLSSNHHHRRPFPLLVSLFPSLFLSSPSTLSPLETFI